jgi:hypothetical protein
VTWYAHLESVRRYYGVSLAGTVLMEEPYNPQLLELFRERMVIPQRRIVAATIREGIEREQIRPGIDIERVLDLLLGAFSAAVSPAAAQGLRGPRRPSTLCGPRFGGRASALPRAPLPSALTVVGPLLDVAMGLRPASWRWGVGR